jgi:hypothetical protein
LELSGIIGSSRSEASSAQDAPLSLYWLAGNCVVTSDDGRTPVASFGLARSATQPFQVLMGLVDAWVKLLRTVGVELVAVHLLFAKPTKSPTRGWFVSCV